MLYIKYCLFVSVALEDICYISSIVRLFQWLKRISVIYKVLFDCFSGSR